MNFNIRDIQGIDETILDTLGYTGIVYIISEAGDEYQFWYGIGAGESGYEIFDTKTLPAEYSPAKDYSAEEMTEFLEKMGYSTEEEFKSLTLPVQITELYQYWGFERVFGESYGKGFTVTTTGNLVDFVAI